MTKQITSNILSKEHRAAVKSFLQSRYGKDMKELKILRGFGFEFIYWNASFKINERWYRVAGHFESGNIIFEGEF